MFNKMELDYLMEHVYKRMSIYLDAKVEKDERDGSFIFTKNGCPNFDCPLPLRKYRENDIKPGVVIKLWGI